jgi:peptide-methionine (R)-S-oxide reductase
MNRRHLLATALLAPFAGGAARANYVMGTSKEGVEALRRNWRQLLAKDAQVASDATPLTLSDDAWRARLSPASYHVLRDEGTEYPGTSPLNGEKRDGVYVCAGCALPVFTSAMKFDSGTGWPSFVTSIPGAFAMGPGSKSVFVGLEVHCAKCAGHHGHIFDDGPKPLGDRWCINGVSLRFIPQSGAAAA